MSIPKAFHLCDMRMPAKARRGSTRLTAHNASLRQLGIPGRSGRTLRTVPILAPVLTTSLDCAAIGAKVDADELVGAADVAAILRLSRPNSVTTYLRRYPDYPKPVVDMSTSRVSIWRRRDIEQWQRTMTIRP
jgi:hypothetical protein